MLIGEHQPRFPEDYATPAITMASVIANQFGEADGLKLSALIAIGLLLFIITALINLIAKLVMKKLSHA